ncbi:MAG TPA: hypothetical protein VIP11_11720 [Gemmatimonadaceae bacterium]
MSEIDWNVELRKISREYDGLPPERTRTQIRLQKIQEVAARHRLNERLSIIGLWVRLALVAVLTVSLFWWPYGRSCGFPLVAFLISNAMVIAGGLSLTPRTWRERMVWPFGGSIVLVVVAWTVIALHTLPRLGYAPLGATTAGWTCTTTR